MRQRTLVASLGALAALVSSLGLLGPASQPAAAASQASARVPVGIIAVAVREQGYNCQQPSNIRPDKAHSQPDREAWIITCEDGRYRVKFKGGDQGATVERL